MKIEAGAESEVKKRWKVVRLDSGADVPGDLVSADEVTGEVVTSVKGENQTFNLHQCGIKIVSRGR
jgi:hypothetical protein